MLDTVNSVWRFHATSNYCYFGTVPTYTETTMFRCENHFTKMYIFTFSCWSNFYAINFISTLILSGDLVYNATDGLGWCYVARCNASCKVEVHSSPCGTAIPTPVSSTTSTSPFIPSTTPSTTTLDCLDENPPRKV